MQLFMNARTWAPGRALRSHVTWAFPPGVAARAAAARVAARLRRVALRLSPWRAAASVSAATAGAGTSSPPWRRPWPRRRPPPSQRGPARRMAPEPVGVPTARASRRPWPWRGAAIRGRDGCGRRPDAGGCSPRSALTRHSAGYQSEGLESQSHGLS